MNVYYSTYHNEAGFISKVAVKGKDNHDDFPVIEIDFMYTTYDGDYFGPMVTANLNRARGDIRFVNIILAILAEDVFTITNGANEVTEILRNRFGLLHQRD